MSLTATIEDRKYDRALERIRADGRAYAMDSTIRWSLDDWRAFRNDPDILSGPLSGEWAGDPTIRDVDAYVTMLLDREPTPDEAPDFWYAFEEGYETFLSEQMAAYEEAGDI